jgi:vacuolar-type H+-ATPase subunit F/Vma7
VSTIEAAFQDFTERRDIAILLINQHVSQFSCRNYRRLVSSRYIFAQIAEKIRPTVDKYQQAFPALLEIPAKDFPYGSPFFSWCQPVAPNLSSDRSRERLSAQAGPETVWRVNLESDL